MTPNHHLDDATVLRFAGGNLDEAFSVVASAHIAGCVRCARAVRQARNIGGHALEAVRPSQVAEDAFDRLMDRIEADDRRGAAKMSIDEDPDSDVPLPLRRYVGKRLDSIVWKVVAPGVRKHDLKLAGTARSGQSLYMLHIAPGVAVPEHGHGGSEMTLVLSGAYSDSLGRFASGDVADLDEHIEHQPRVEKDAACICLVATEAPTRFKGFFSRLLQPIVGI